LLQIVFFSYTVFGTPFVLIFRDVNMAKATNFEVKAKVIATRKCNAVNARNEKKIQYKS